MATARSGSFYQLGLWGLAKALAVLGLLWVGALILTSPPRHFHYYDIRPTPFPLLGLGVAVVAAWILPVAFWLVVSRVRHSEPGLRLVFSPYRGIAAGVIFVAAGWFEPAIMLGTADSGFSSHSALCLAGLFFAGFLGFGLTGARQLIATT